MQSFQEASLRGHSRPLLFTVKPVHFFALLQRCSGFSVIYEYSISVANSTYRVRF